MYQIRNSSEFKNMHKTHYKINLTDKQWQVIEKVIDIKK